MFENCNSIKLLRLSLTYFLLRHHTVLAHKLFMFIAYLNKDISSVDAGEQNDDDDYGNANGCSNDAEMRGTDSPKFYL